MVLIYFITACVAGYALVFGNGTAFVISTIVTLLALIADHIYDKRQHRN